MSELTLNGEDSAMMVGKLILKELRLMRHEVKAEMRQLRYELLSVLNAQPQDTRSTQNTDSGENDDATASEPESQLVDKEEENRSKVYNEGNVDLADPEDMNVTLNLVSENMIEVGESGSIHSEPKPSHLSDNNDIIKILMENSNIETNPSQSEISMHSKQQRVDNLSCCSSSATNQIKNKKVFKSPRNTLRVLYSKMPKKGKVLSTDLQNKHKISHIRTNPCSRKSMPFKVHVCEYCSSVFETSSLLKRHIRKHTGEKPFGCHLCPRYFTRKYALERHILYIHNKEYPL